MVADREILVAMIKMTEDEPIVRGNLHSTVRAAREALDLIRKGGPH